MGKMSLSLCGMAVEKCMHILRLPAVIGVRVGILRIVSWGCTQIHLFNVLFQRKHYNYFYFP